MFQKIFDQQQRRITLYYILALKYSILKELNCCMIDGLKQLH